MPGGVLPALVLSLSLVFGGGIHPASSGDAGFIVQLTNQTRAQAGLAPLSDSGGLTQVAQAWAEQMASGAVPFQHNPNTTGQIPGGWTGWAENIAWRSGGGAGDLYAQWINSAPHYANILGDFDQIGVGFATAANGAVYGVQVFGKYSSGAAVPPQAAPPALQPPAPAPQPQPQGPPPPAAGGAGAGDADGDAGSAATAGSGQVPVDADTASEADAATDATPTATPKPAPTATVTAVRSAGAAPGSSAEKGGDAAAVPAGGIVVVSTIAALLLAGGAVIVVRRVRRARPVG